MNSMQVGVFGRWAQVSGGEKEGGGCRDFKYMVRVQDTVKECQLS